MTTLPRVVIDACVLANFGACDLLLRLAEPPRLFIPMWSQTILDEVHRTQTTKLGWPAHLADHFQEQVCHSFPKAMTSDYEDLIPQLSNDPKDRHVLAAAIRASARSILTFNLKDFPKSALSLWSISAQHPDDFSLELFQRHSERTTNTLQEIASSRNRSLNKHLSHLAKSLPKFSGTIPRIDES